MSSERIEMDDSIPYTHDTLLSAPILYKGHIYIYPSILFLLYHPILVQMNIVRCIILKNPANASAHPAGFFFIFAVAKVYDAVIVAC